MNWQTIGFDKNKKFFESVTESGRLGHAYLFSGQEMIGKKSFALEMAGLITGSANVNQDILLVDPTSSESGRSIMIEEVRKIKNFVSLSPYAGRYKFVIIDDAHLLTVEAQNALLKVLEEPGPSAILILVTANPKSLLPTIISRCQEIKFPPHPKAVMAGVIEHSGLSKINAEFLVDFAAGRIGLIKRIVQDKSFDDVRDSVEELMHLIKADINERLAVAQKLTDEKNKTELPQKILYWTLYLRTRLDEPKSHKILKGLLALHEIISRPQFNQRLALESFLVSL